MYGWATASHGSQPGGGTLQLWSTADLAQQSHCTAVSSGLGNQLTIPRCELLQVIDLQQ